MKNKLTYSLNYRKPKDQYSDNDELMVCIRYYHKDHKNAKAKIIKKSTGVKCKLADWDKDWHNNDDRSPIKSTDPNYIEKNNEKSTVKKKKYGIMSLIFVSNEIMFKKRNI